MSLSKFELAIWDAADEMVFYSRLSHLKTKIAVTVKFLVNQDEADSKGTTTRILESLLKDLAASMDILGSVQIPKLVNNLRFTTSFMYSLVEISGLIEHHILNLQDGKKPGYTIEFFSLLTKKFEIAMEGVLLGWKMDLSAAMGKGALTPLLEVYQVAAAKEAEEMKAKAKAKKKARYNYTGTEDGIPPYTTRRDKESDNYIIAYTNTDKTSGVYANPSTLKDIIETVTSNIDIWVFLPPEVPDDMWSYPLSKWIHSGELVNSLETAFLQYSAVIHPEGDSSASDAMKDNMLKQRKLLRAIWGQYHRLPGLDFRLCPHLHGHTKEWDDGVKVFEAIHKRVAMDMWYRVETLKSDLIEPGADTVIWEAGLMKKLLFNFRHIGEYLRKAAVQEWTECQEWGWMSYQAHPSDYAPSDEEMVEQLEGGEIEIEVFEE